MRDQGLIDRLHRADSWIQAALRQPSDHLHEAFIFLYIALNCLYGRRPYEGDEAQYKQDLHDFLKKILALHEEDRRQHGAILMAAVSAARQDGAVLIRDRFLVNRYWRGGQSAGVLQAKLNQDAAKALERLEAGALLDFLTLAFRRVYVLRSQVMQGCATYGPRTYGRGSLTKGVRFLRAVVPALYELMRRYGQIVKWDPVPYPRLGSAQLPRF